MAELSILAPVLIIIAGSYLSIFPKLAGNSLDKIAIYDVGCYAFALTLSGFKYWGSSYEFSLLLFNTNWFWFTKKMEDFEKNLKEVEAEVKQVLTNACKDLCKHDGILSLDSDGELCKACAAPAVNPRDMLSGLEKPSAGAAHEPLASRGGQAAVR